MRNPWRWLRKNLFRSVPDGIVTVVVGSAILYVLFRFLRFIFVTGRWKIIRSNLSLYITGSWPSDELWRLSTAVIALAFGAGLVAGFVARARRDSPIAAEPLVGTARWLDLAERVWPPVAAVLVLLVLVDTPGPWLLTAGTALAAILGRLGGERLPGTVGTALTSVLTLLAIGLVWFLASGVGWDSWGGLVLNLFLASISILLCFPLGVLLALGRRSTFPIIRWISTSYIELFRGVPLIALLLMANVALGFFIPQSLAPGKVVRAIVIFVLFTAAYVAGDRPRRPAVCAPWSGRGRSVPGHVTDRGHGPDRPASGHPQHHSGPGRAVHQPVQGHDSRWCGHGPDRSAGRG